MEEEDVVIVGAGIAGLATAVALKRVGIRALVIEKSEGLRATGATLSLYPNAWFAMDALGVSHKLINLYTPCKRAYITNVDTGATQEVSFTRADRCKTILSGAVLRVVHRKALLEALAEELPMDTIRFSSKLTSIRTKAQKGHRLLSFNWKMEPLSEQKWAVRGLARFPQGHGLNHDFQQFVTAGAKRAGFVPLNDKEFHWFLTGKATWIGKDMARDPKVIQKEVIDKFAQDLPQLYTVIVQHSDLSTITWAPLLHRFPWDIIFGNVSMGNITVAGDAMHHMTPDLGQNECAALEDAVVLGQQFGELIAQRSRLVPLEVAQALTKHAQKRRWRAARLIATSYLSG
ncbi:hypothetical protein RGQ29_022918 [Quercus rubra]|uniref:FAD-binding domain-containing protein n=1 Tax=Quercus rubra TaxID=3512 RepID=A0AAN7F511_QUERU|nr:hypothetical protein RGQ29_022918 [Quercus rubra]